MANFQDVNGKSIVPGSLIIVAVSSGRSRLRKGIVYRTSIGRGSGYKNDIRVSLMEENTGRYMGTFFTTRNMMVIG